MKTTLFTASLVMACLMLPGSGAAVAATEFTATFNLKAKYSSVTCLSSLATSGDISGTEIDFGTFSQDTPPTSKSVVLTLDCSNDTGTDLPDTVKVGFEVIEPAKVDLFLNNRLYPSPLNGGGQTILYYDWEWDEKISNTIKATDVNSGHTALNPNKDKIDLKGGSAGDVYEVAPQNSGTQELRFPLKITRNVSEEKISELGAGDYTASVKVTVSYE